MAGIAHWDFFLFIIFTVGVWLSTSISFVLIRVRRVGAVLLLQFFFKKGIPVIIMERFDAVEFLRNIEKYKITFATTVPPIMVILARHPGQYCTQICYSVPATLIFIFYSCYKLRSHFVEDINVRCRTVKRLTSAGRPSPARFIGCESPDCPGYVHTVGGPCCTF